ncbi:MAG: N-formylglutamate amidohydrolase [Phenylobacterium sp.]|uniref:N-formylglutamate amidohydrolase n=1 Tax=Phenylobacterium sp. TaxID=1871053 RepID=UPI002734FB35|nr:N-formylglutamate amidohydrolase [Phenylobacterium sp.]MDP3174242.1 N-formylglutamate amidohydrolase [Phenylobacterium sp.]
MQLRRSQASLAGFQAPARQSEFTPWMSSKPLLTPNDPAPALVLNPGAASPFLLVGDHAGRAVPRGLNDLGVSAADMERHIAWDLGVAELGVRLSAALGACFLSQRYSRLVIDSNRDPARTDAIPSVSDETVIPGNADLTPEAAQARERAIHAPYQAAIAHELDDRARKGLPTVLVALHSFTPRMAGFDRPWRYGVLHRGDSAFSSAVLALLVEAHGDAVGDNLPYRMDEVDYTIPFHADARGLDYLELEVRQDLLAGAAGLQAVTDMVAALLPRALQRTGAASRA